MAEKKKKTTEKLLSEIEGAIERSRDLITILSPKVARANRRAQARLERATPKGLRGTYPQKKRKPSRTVAHGY